MKFNLFSNLEYEVKVCKSYSILPKNGSIFFLILTEGILNVLFPLT